QIKLSDCNKQLDAEMKNNSIKSWLSFFKTRLLDMFTGTGARVKMPDKSEKTAPENSSALPTTAPTEVFVLWDALGDGRVLGVFTDEATVEELRQINPYYYRFYRCRLDQATDYGLNWLEKDQKWQFERILVKHGLKRKHS
ncbi:MAG: hypothetical protein AB1403_15585, partial [Candidatus Riflebacteria bacterium]